MLFTNPPTPNEVKPEPVISRQPCCPACGGPLMDLRGQARCTRCYFTWCADCENTQATPSCDTQYD